MNQLNAFLYYIRILKIVNLPKKLCSILTEDKNLDFNSPAIHWNNGIIRGEK